MFQRRLSEKRLGGCCVPAGEKWTVRFGAGATFQGLEGTTPDKGHGRPFETQGWVELLSGTNAALPSRFACVVKARARKNERNFFDDRVVFFVGGKVGICGHLMISPM